MIVSVCVPLLLRDELRRDRGVQLKWHDPRATFIEGLMSRGDRRLGPVIEQVWRRGVPTMYRVFQRSLRVSPGAYRRHFLAPEPERRSA